MDILEDTPGYSREFEAAMYRTVKKVSLDYERMKLNTAVAAMIILVNDFHAKGRVTKGELRSLLLILNPVAPHITEEMWEMAGFETHMGAVVAHVGRT